MPRDLPPDRAPTAVPIGAFLPEAYTEAEVRSGHVTRVEGARSGFDRLDRAVGGLQAGALYVLAGRPGMGASELAVALARGAASQAEQPADVLWVPLRDAPFLTAWQFVQAEAASRPRDDLPPRDRHEPWRVHVAASERLQRLPIRILDCAPRDASTVESSVRAWAEGTRTPRVVVIDDAALLFSPGAPSATTVHALLRLAHDAQLALVLVGPVSRRVDRRVASRRKPRLGDLALPASVEHAADVIVFVYRASYYYRRTSPERSRHVELIVEKNRFGPTYTLAARFDDDHWAIMPQRRDV